MEKGKKIIDKAGRIFGTSGTRNGAYSVGLTVIVLAVVIVFNLIVGQIPEAYRNIDVSSTKIYDISDTSRDLLKDLDKEVDMTVLAVKDETDERIVTFISKYAALSNRIHVEWVDPVLHPSALTEYDTSEDTIVVSCEETGKTTTVSFSDILVMDTYSYYYYGTTSYTEFDGEGQLTSAVNYVTSETEKTICQSTGHGESTLSSTITDLMDKNSYTLSEVNLLMSDSVPDDCDLFLMYAPTADLTEEETEMLGTYLDGGGKVMILFGEAGAAELPNLEALLEEYGIGAVEGYIADPARDTITTSEFMSSSDQAYAVTETSQEQGRYTIEAVAVESTGGEESDTTDSSDTEAEESASESEEGTDEILESRLTVISGASMIDQQITDTFTTLENTTLFMNAVTANFEGVQNLSIEPKSLSIEYNTMQHTGVFGLLGVFGIPAAVVIGGFVVWFRRRKR